MRYKKSLLLVSLLSVSVLLLSRCDSTVITTRDPRGPGFAGSAQCKNCHKNIYDAYAASTHFNSTHEANNSTVRSDIEWYERFFFFGDSSIVGIHRTDSGFYQRYTPANNPLSSHVTLDQQHRMDIVFGLKHAQTFLYWKDNRTYELPLSYYIEKKQWGTSPGFSAKHPDFNRFIGVNCYECHTSYIGSKLDASTAGIEEVLEKDKLVYGIDCERCHGPALQHVNFHLDNPGEKKPKYIVRFADLTRQQKLDVCAMCHSGNNKMQAKSTFQFRPGDTLTNYFALWPAKDVDTNLDVHGNQYQLLSQSKCFMNSKVMDCSTCHSPHGNAGTDLQVYSNVCMSCHKGVQHNFGGDVAKTNMLKNNCVDCHMPNMPSRAITFQLLSAEPKVAYMLRTHKIAVYR